MPGIIDVSVKIDPGRILFKCCRHRLIPGYDEFYFTAAGQVRIFLNNRYNFLQRCNSFCFKIDQVKPVPAL